MADLQPLRTLRYEPAAVASLADVIAPPYDVIDDAMRAELAARSPYNVVRIDLPKSYDEAAATLREWRSNGVLVQEDEPGRIRPHERPHPGPKEDRLKLTRATRTNLSPIFSLFPDSDGIAERAIAHITGREPFVTVEGDTLWRTADDDLIAELQMALANAELLIADGHHRYETARVYADEVGGEGEHRYVLMLLCALSDPGLLVFPTHRLLTGLKDDR